MSVKLTTVPSEWLDVWRGARFALAAFVLGLCLLAWLFQSEIAAAVTVWNNSTAYTHCYLVLPIVAFLIYERRNRLSGLQIQPQPWLASCALPLAITWLAAERLGLMEGRQFVALACVELLVLSVFGQVFVRAFAVPLLYLVFLVPAGAFLTAPLQDFTAHFIVGGLNILGIPNFADAHSIEIPEGIFYVAEACAGLRFLVAAVAFGTLYSAIVYRSTGRRLLFLLVSIIVPVFANGVRALGIVLAGHWVGSAKAVEADHLIYGWVFFSLILVMLILAGLPFREDERQARYFETSRTQVISLHAALVPSLLVGCLVASGPLIAGWMDRAAAAEPVSQITSPVGCQADPMASIDEVSRTLLAVSGAAESNFVCESGRIRLRVVAFPPRTNSTRILAAQRSLTGQDIAEDVAVASVPDVGWQSIVTHNPSQVSASALWINGRPVSGWRSRLLQAARSFGSPGAPVILAIIEPNKGGQQALEAFLAEPDGVALTTALIRWSAPPL